jgi:hypothetical protein
MPFETPFPEELFAGEITATAHEENILLPQTIIRTDQKWAVEVNWTNKGQVTGMIAGEYCVHLLLERMGPGTDLELTDTPHRIKLIPGESPRVYTDHVDVPAGKVPAGIYKLVTVLQYWEPTGNPGPMAGYVENGPLLQFYNP